MATYKPRVIDEAIERRLKNKGAILVEGAKWCGKTTTCEQHAASILYMSDPDRVKQNLQLADISPRSLLQGETPRLIDEWQMAPKLWDAVRFEADHRFAAKIDTSKMKEPSFLMVLTGTSPYAYKREDGVSLYRVFGIRRRAHLHHERHGRGIFHRRHLPPLLDLYVC